MTLDQLISGVRAQIATRSAEREQFTAGIAAARATLTDEHPTLTEEQAREVAALDARRSAVDVQIAELRGQLERYEAEKAADDAARTLMSQVQPSNRAASVGGAVVTSEARTYTRESSRLGTSFFADAYRAEYSMDFTARERLARHMNECRVEGELSTRATTTSTANSLVVPQYLPDLYALPIRNGRPFANAVSSMELPDQGMTITVPRITTGAATAIQATQNSNVQSTDQAVTDLVVPVVTIAGQQDMSRQLVERGVPGIDQIVYRDLAAAYAANLDSQILSGSGSSGQILGVQNTSGINAATIYSAVLSVSNFYSKIAGQIYAVTNTGAGVTPSLIVMSPRRWGWLTAQVDSTGRPLNLATANGPYNATALNLAPGAYSAEDPIGSGFTVVGSIHGIPVITDGNVPQAVGTNSEDLVFVADNSQLILWENGGGAPSQFRFDQTLGNQLTVKLVVYGYAAFTAGRYPAAVGKIGGLDTVGGNGQIAPTF